MTEDEWEEWSNELAEILPEDAETWPGVNPEGAQESIILAAFKHLVEERKRLVAVRELHYYVESIHIKHPGWCHACSSNWPCPTVQLLYKGVMDD